MFTHHDPGALAPYLCQQNTTNHCSHLSWWNLPRTTFPERLASSRSKILQKIVALDSILQITRKAKAVSVSVMMHGTARKIRHAAMVQTAQLSNHDLLQVMSSHSMFSRQLTWSLGCGKLFTPQSKVLSLPPSSLTTTHPAAFIIQIKDQQIIWRSSYKVRKLYPSWCILSSLLVDGFWVSLCLSWTDCWWWPSGCIWPWQHGSNYTSLPIKVVSLVIFWSLMLSCSRGNYSRTTDSTGMKTIADLLWVVCKVWWLLWQMEQGSTAMLQGLNQCCGHTIALPSSAKSTDSEPRSVWDDMELLVDKNGFNTNMCRPANFYSLNIPLEYELYWTSTTGRVC